MLALIQRVTSASVTVDDAVVGAIGPGLLALVAVEPGDAEPQFRRMAERLLGYRVFDDGNGKMNRSLTDTGGGLLLVSQFTLAADTRSGMRPSFSTAAPPAEAERGFDRFGGELESIGQAADLRAARQSADRRQRGGEPAIDEDQPVVEVLRGEGRSIRGQARSHSSLRPV